MSSLLLCSALALAIPPLDVHQETLPNGVRVVVHADPALPDLAVRVRLADGANADPIGRAGLAHLLEHLTFERSANATQGERLRWLAEAGGEINAFTGPDDVVYHLRAAPEGLDRALWLLAEQLGSPAFDEADLANQLDVTGHERADSWRSTLLAAQVVRFLIPRGHPYSRMGIGKAGELEATGLAEARVAAAHLLRPSNMTVVVAGPAPADEGLAAARRWFGAMPVPAETRPTFPAIPPAIATPAPIDRATWRRAEPPERVWVDTSVDVPRVRRAWRTFPAGGADRLALEVSAWLLWNALAADHVTVQPFFGREGGYYIIAGESRRPRALARRIEAEAERLAWDGPTDTELELIRGQMAYSRHLAREDADGRADLLLDCLVEYGDAACEERARLALEGLAPDAVRDAVRRWLRPDAGAWVGIADGHAPLPRTYRQFAR